MKLPSPQKEKEIVNLLLIDAEWAQLQRDENGLRGWIKRHSQNIKDKIAIFWVSFVFVLLACLLWECVKQVTFEEPNYRTPVSQLQELRGAE